jgi:hypothetical protein
MRRDGKGFTKTGLFWEGALEHESSADWMQKFECEEKAIAAANCQSPGREEARCLAVRACSTNDKNLTMEHALRKPVESGRAYKQRRNAVAFGMIVALTLAAAMAILLVG